MQREVRGSVTLDLDEWMEVPKWNRGAGDARAQSRRSVEDWRWRAVAAGSRSSAGWLLPCWNLETAAARSAEGQRARGRRRRAAAQRPEGQRAEGGGPEGGGESAAPVASQSRL